MGASGSRVNNAERILTALDRHLDHEVSLVLYGRAALVLGFPDASADMALTMDVDAIIRLCVCRSR